MDHTLTVVLMLIAIAILMQGGAMVGIWLAIRKIPDQIEAVRSDVKQRIDPLVKSFEDLLNDSREPVKTITANLAEISRLLRERSSNVDAALAELVEKSRLQLLRVDQMISGVVEKVEDTADTIHRQVLVPIREVSALIKGVRTGLEFLFSRRRTTSVSEATQDEQLFI
jgi:uncharacterized protein Yka (UPF0111/DUF47 family)